MIASSLQAEHAQFFCLDPTLIGLTPRGKCQAPKTGEQFVLQRGASYELTLTTSGGALLWQLFHMNNKQYHKVKAWSPHPQRMSGPGLKLAQIALDVLWCGQPPDADAAVKLRCHDCVVQANWACMTLCRTWQVFAHLPHMYGCQHCTQAKPTK